MKYRVTALVTGSISAEYDAQTEEDAVAMMFEEYAGDSITLCASCAGQIEKLIVSENSDAYEVVEI